MNDATAAALAAGSIVYMLVVLAIAIVVLVGLWKVFEKAGKPGWGAIVPLYNLYCLFEMTFGTGWLFLLIFVPCVGAIMTIIMWIKLAMAFDKGVGFGIGILFLPFIFVPMLGFGDAQYVGPSKG
ncbi:MAG: signal peptidase I [Lachnospiraceae bacterium]|nr:signal peptidase I [Lachnospiraceae bacterium]